MYIHVTVSTFQKQNGNVCQVLILQQLWIMDLSEIIAVVKSLEVYYYQINLTKCQCHNEAAQLHLSCSLRKM